jgi:hypothetical protein
MESERILEEIQGLRRQVDEFGRELIDHSNAELAQYRSIDTRLSGLESFKSKALITGGALGGVISLIAQLLGE